MSVTEETDTVYLDSDHPVDHLTDRSCLVLRSGALLKLDPGVVIESADVTKTVISCIDMEGGGVVGGHIKSIWPDEDGTGHGTFFSHHRAGKEQ